MVKLSWQVVVVLCVAMTICGAIILASFWVEQAEEIRNYAMTLFAALSGYGGGKLQTAWEIKKLNGGSNARP
jgi:hypothetical protein